MVIFSHLYLNSRNIPGFSSFFDGVLPVVAAVIFSVAYNIYKDSKDKVFSLLLVILSFVLTSLIKGYISIILPLLICGGLNLFYNGDKLKKITNPKKAFLRIKGIIIASLIMIILFVFLNNAPISSLEFNLAKSLQFRSSINLIGTNFFDFFILFIVSEILSLALGKI